MRDLRGTSAVITGASSGIGNLFRPVDPVVSVHGDRRSRARRTAKVAKAGIALAGAAAVAIILFAPRAAATQRR